MFKDADGLRYSPSDLTVFLESAFGSWMDRWYAERCATDAVGDASTGGPWPEQLPCAPDEATAEDECLQAKGYEHERAMLRQLAEEGWRVVEIANTSAAAEETLRAMRTGEGLIYQGYLKSDAFAGYADFLVRREGESALGPHHYEVWDAKLARCVMPDFVIQLCAFAEMLERIQGRRPHEIELLLGNGERPRFVTDNFYYYYQALKRAFLDFHRRFDPADVCHPGTCAEHGRWSAYAEQILRAIDHVSQVAGIRHTHIRKLEAAGITTLTALAESPAVSIPRLDRTTFHKLRAQAALQLRSRESPQPLYEVIRPPSDDPRRGLALLPPPSLLDVYFDMEGFPLVREGLEYLFGAVYEEGSEPTFVDWWAHDAAGEKRAFEEFVDWVYERFTRDPTMHVYHYASYETAALRRLMGRHGTREREVDDLLRAEVFVDLYTIVRQGLRVGTCSYSLKHIERLYMPAREGDITTATASVVAYQKWLEAPDGESWRDSTILRQIRDYNRIDCESSYRLAQWLREVQERERITHVPRTEGTRERGGRTETEADGAGEGRKDSADNAALAARMLAALEKEPDISPERERVQTLLAHLLEFHWREAKPVFWRKFERRDMSDEDLCEDIECLGALKRTRTEPERVGRSTVYEYRFPREQSTKLEERARCFLTPDLVPCTIERLDLERGVVAVRMSDKQGVPRERTSLIPDEFLSPKQIVDALRRYAEAWMDRRVISSAVDDFLHRRPPRIRDHEGGPLGDGAEDLVQHAVDLVKRLDASTLCIQGPPGTGKTYTAARMIVDLLRDGCHVGVTSNSHKAVTNLLVAAAKAARDAGVVASFVKVGSDDETELARAGIRQIKETKDAARALTNGPVVIGGTAWLFSRPELQQCFSHLFVDEAGQVSVANVVATGLAAENIVLIGDQMQLSQPIQGTHPGESGMSALDYLLAGRATIPPDFGLFLDTSYRMHPDVCTFISQALYEGRLKPHPSTSRHRVVAAPTGPSRIVHRDVGVLMVPVEHHDNSQASPEEVDMIERIVGELLEGSVCDRFGYEQDLSLERDVLIVAPYNLQVRMLQRRLGSWARVGSVDKFQGQEAPVVIVSMCASTLEDCPRGAEFLLSRNRLNVAISRAQSLAIVVGSPALLFSRCQTVEQMELMNLYCRLADYADSLENTPRAHGSRRILRVS
jgi:uncharacterized protein